MTKYCVTLISLLFLCHFFAHAQSFGNVDCYNTSSGLPNNLVQSVYQDNEGYLWIGTYNALCRYDGKEFKIIRDNFSRSLDGTHSVNTISEDGNGNIWIGTRGGMLASFNYITETWQDYPIQNDYVTCIYCGAGQGVWIGTGNGTVMKIEKGALKKIYGPGAAIKNISLYKPGILLISTERLTLLDMQTGRPYHDPDKPALPGSETGVVVWHNNMNITWIMPAGKKIFSFNIASKKISRGTLWPEWPVNMKETPCCLQQNGNLVLLYKNRLVEFSQNCKLLTDIDLRDFPESLTSTFVNQIFEDNTGLIWVATNDGLLKIDPNRFQFDRLTEDSRTDHIKYNYIRTLYSRKNEIWAGAKDGQVCRIKVDTLSGKTQSKQYYKAITSGGQVLSSYTINSFSMDNKGRMWAGGNEGLFSLKPGEHVFRQADTAHSHSGVYLVVWSVCADDDENILLGTTEGMFVYHPQRLTMNRTYTDSGAADFPVWNIYKTTGGKIWAGTRKGLYMAVHTGSSSRYNMVRFKHNAFENRDVWSIVQGKGSNIWISSTSKGILKIDTLSNTDTLYKKNDGLADDIVSGMVADHHGNLWISTINGLTEYKTFENRFINFTEEDGITSNDFNFNACAVSPWGKIYLGTKRGITSFYPDRVHFDEAGDRPAEITGLQVKGAAIPYRLYKDKTLHLPYSSNNLGISFAILDYHKSYSHRYRFRLDGFDKEWQYTGYNNPSTAYTNLPPGEYTFLVQASADGKKWSLKTASVHLIIHAAWWQNIYIQLLAGLVFASGISLLIVYRTQQLIKKERDKTRQQKALAELEMKALRAQMNPHFLFNAIVAIQNYILRKDTLQANEYLARFARLIRLSLDASRRKAVMLKNEINMLELYVSLEKLRFDHKFDYRFDIDNSIAADTMEIPSMLLQPFAENAINHGLVHRDKKGFLNIKFSCDHTKSRLICIIEDNGIGRAAAALLKKKNNPGHESAGLKIIDERIKAFLELEEMQISVDITDKMTDDGKPEGTIVRIEIPIIYHQTQPTHENHNSR